MPKHFISYHLFDAMLESRKDHSFYKPPLLHRRTGEELEAAESSHLTNHDETG